MSAQHFSLEKQADSPWQWDIFCRVIDNFGDIGVCLRLAIQAASHGQRVRLWIDDPSALAWMAPHGAKGVEICAWDTPLSCDADPSDVLIEAFGCEIPENFVAECARRVSKNTVKPTWINLEYLSAEDWVARNHGLPSPVLHGPAAGWTKWFYYPGFSSDTGGLLREPGVIERQRAFDRSAWRARNAANSSSDSRWVSLFCYEPAALSDWLEQCDTAEETTHLLVTAGRAQAMLKTALVKRANNLKVNSLKRLPDIESSLSIKYFELISQPEFDEMLWACDLNFVRGEDSLVRALWAGQPLVWHIYPQTDSAHGPKLQAFLDWLDAPQSLRRFHDVWNGFSEERLPLIDDPTLATWRTCIAAARERLLQQTDLLTQLLGFCASKR